jgi:putative salt-induced outer membrane protein
MLRKTLMAMFAMFLMTTAAAQQETEAAEEEESPWSGAVSLGYLSTSGNTETTSYNTKLRVGYVSDGWEHSLRAAANGADESEQTTAEAYQAGWKSEYSFTEHDFVFGTVDWRKDRFSGVDEQLTEAIGYGRRLIDTEKHLLSVGVGVGHRSADLADGTSESGVIGRGSIDYNWTWNETAGFDQNVIVESGSDNTYIESVSAVRARLFGDFAVVLSYTIKHNTDVPIGSENTDRLSAVSIEYAF